MLSAFVGGAVAGVSFLGAGELGVPDGWDMFAGVLVGSLAGGFVRRRSRDGDGDGGRDPQ